jgi:hypothetical protein
VGAGFVNRVARFSLTKAKVSQASKRARRDICLVGPWPLAVHGSVGVPEAQRARISFFMSKSPR